jgi:putative peptidoglycan lipid II flippase
MAAADDAQHDSSGQQGLASAAALMIFATLASSITGLARQMVFSREFGTTPEYNAYIQAFRIPDLFYFLIAGGALRTGFIPVFTQYVAEGRSDKAWRTFSVTFFLLLVLSVVGVAIGMAAAPWLARETVARGLAPGYQDLCARLMRTMFPAQIFFIVGGLLMGTLNAQKHFTMPALGPITYNLVIISGALASLPIARHAGLYEPQDQLPYRLWCLALFVVAGAALGSFFLQIPPLLRMGARLQAVLDLRDPGLQKLAVLALPVIIGLAVSEINFVVTTSIATLVSEKAASLLDYPNRVLKLPPRMFGAGVAIVLFPTLAIHFAKGQMDAYRRDLALVMRSTLFLSIPAAIVSAALAVPIIRLLFEGHAFGREDTLGTAQVLYWSSFGIAPLSLQYIVARGFYALHETRVPLWTGIATAVLSAGLSLAVYRPLGVVGLAAVFSATSLFNVLVLTWLLRLRVGLLEGRRMLAMLGRLILPCVALGIVCYVGAAAAERLVGTEGLLAKTLTCLGPLAVGLAIFLALCVILKVEELQTAVSLVVSRFNRR